MEYVGKQSLHSYLKSKPNRSLEEDEAKHIFQQILEALAYLHEKHIIHRDLKLENILLDENFNVKIIDYGFSIIT
jgi:MAP/microtubule affinity-regulating kinase